jgi:hypothetical protein
MKALAQILLAGSVLATLQPQWVWIYIFIAAPFVTCLFYSRKLAENLASVVFAALICCAVAVLCWPLDVQFLLAPITGLFFLIRGLCRILMMALRALP